MRKQPQYRERVAAKVAELRKLLMTERDLDRVSEYFHDALVMDDAFMAAGALSSNPRVVMALEAVLERVAPGHQLGAPWMMCLEPQTFCHGYTSWGRGHVIFFYFAQVDLGFCSYSPSLTSTDVVYTRFNLTNVMGAATWGASQSVHATARKVLQ